MQTRALVAATLVALCASIATDSRAQGASDVDRTAQLRYVWLSGPGGYDPAMSKNQFTDTAYMLPVYDSLVRLDAKGNLVAAIAASWTVSPDGKTITFQLLPGLQFTDGSPLNAAVVARNLNRTRDPSSAMSTLLRGFDGFEAPNPTTVVAKLKAPDSSALFTLATSVGMIVSGKALDDGVNLLLTPVGSGPYKLVNSGPQSATYERNEAYYDKAQNQAARFTVGSIVDVAARIAAVQTGQADIALLQADLQSIDRVDALVKSGRFIAHKVLTPNSMPLWLNTKIKPFDNPKVRLALNYAIDREAISKGITNGECKPASQPLPPGIVGHDDTLKPYPYDVAKAKTLMQEAGVGPFSFDALVSTQEPQASIGVAIKQQLQPLGITMNIIPTPGSQLRPLFRQGNHGAMVMTASVAAPDPGTIIDAFLMSPDNPGGMNPQFAAAVAAARAKPVGSQEQESAFKALSRAAYDDPRQVYVCWNPVILLARKGVVGLDQTAYDNAVPIPDVRTYGLAKTP